MNSNVAPTVWVFGDKCLTRVYYFPNGTTAWALIEPIGAKFQVYYGNGASPTRGADLLSFGKDSNYNDMYATDNLDTACLTADARCGYWGGAIQYRAGTLLDIERKLADDPLMKE